MKKNKVENDLYKRGVQLSFVFIGLAIVGFLILLLPMILQNYDYSTLGSLGDAVGGFLNPIIAISSALLMFLAFYMQYQANQQVQNQFEKQQIDDSNNFEYKNFKERINLIINEIDNFNVAFHKGKLISKLSDLNKDLGKKYNFTGVQGVNLFLIEYFRDKNEKESNNNKEFKVEDSFHSIFLSISNLIILFYNTHNGIINSFLPKVYKIELQELLNYLYNSKISYIMVQLRNNHPNHDLLEMILILFEYYSPDSDIESAKN